MAHYGWQNAFYTNVKHECIQRGEGFWLAARSRRGKRSSATLTEQQTMLQEKRPGTTMRSCLELVLPCLMQKIQTIGCYLFPVKMGSLMSKMTANYVSRQVYL
jgi:hypothetical protein